MKHLMLRTLPVRRGCNDRPIHRVFAELLLSHSTCLVEFIDVDYLNEPTPFVLVEEFKCRLELFLRSCDRAS